jgi:prepilin-type N-terminal cleavage/methylation domain-containing protein
LNFWLYCFCLPFGGIFLNVIYTTYGVFHMTQSTKQAPAAKNAESGFTLVELAIVMIIIGLLIGGILKGQELINNARVSATVAQVKAVESGISGFRDKYAGVPGDIATPTTRLPGCTAALCILNSAATNGDSVISVAAAGTTTQDPGLGIAATSESAASFVQLAASGFIGGVSGSAAALGNAVSNPTTPLGGIWVLGSSTGAAGTGLVGPTTTAATALQNGTYVAMATAPGTAVSAAVGPLNPVQTANIDRKLDDGGPNTGIVRATGAAGAANCADVVGVAGIYNQSLPGALCGLYAKVM